MSELNPEVFGLESLKEYEWSDIPGLGQAMRLKSHDMNYGHSFNQFPVARDPPTPHISRDRVPSLKILRSWKEGYAGLGPGHEAW